MTVSYLQNYTMCRYDISPQLMFQFMSSYQQFMSRRPLTIIHRNFQLHNANILTYDCIIKIDGQPPMCLTACIEIFSLFFQQKTFMQSYFLLTAEKAVKVQLSKVYEYINKGVTICGYQKLQRKCMLSETIFVAARQSTQPKQKAADIFVSNFPQFCIQ